MSEIRASLGLDTSQFTAQISQAQKSVERFWITAGGGLTGRQGEAINFAKFLGVETMAKETKKAEGALKELKDSSAGTIDRLSGLESILIKIGGGNRPLITVFRALDAASQSAASGAGKFGSVLGQTLLTGGLAASAVGSFRLLQKTIEDTAKAYEQLGFQKMDATDVFAASLGIIEPQLKRDKIDAEISKLRNDIKNGDWSITVQAKLELLEKEKWDELKKGRAADVERIKSSLAPMSVDERTMAKIQTFSADFGMEPTLQEKKQMFLDSQVEYDQEVSKRKDQESRKQIQKLADEGNANAALFLKQNATQLSTLGGDTLGDKFKSFSGGMEKGEEQRQARQNALDKLQEQNDAIVERNSLEEMSTDQQLSYYRSLQDSLDASEDLLGTDEEILANNQKWLELQGKITGLTGQQDKNRKRLLEERVSLESEGPIAAAANPEQQRLIEQQAEVERLKNKYEELYAANQDGVDTLEAQNDLLKAQNGLAELQKKQKSQIKTGDVDSFARIGLFAGESASFRSEKARQAAATLVSPMTAGSSATSNVGSLRTPLADSPQANTILNNIYTASKRTADLLAGGITVKGLAVAG